MRILDSLSRWMGYVSTLLIGLLMLLTVADICGRYFFSRPITGSTEISSFMMIVVVFSALAWAAVTGKHIKIDLLMTHFSPRVQVIVDSIIMLAVLGTYVIITWQSALEATQVNKQTSLLQLPYTPFYWIMTVGLVIFCLAIATLVIRNLTKAVKR